MKIIIDIPQGAYELLKNEGVDWLGAEHILDAVANGTPLPKGHGDLVDRGTYCSALEKKIEDWDVTSTEIHDKINGIFIAYNICNRLIPIIEADKESKEEE